MNKLTSPDILFATYQDFLKNKNDYATQSIKWAELLINQIEKPSISVLKNLLKVAQTLEDYKHRFFDGRAITITSGWRSKNYNIKIGGAEKSYHILGLATDFVVAEFTPQEVQKRIGKIHFGGLEYAPSWTHIDLRGMKARFKP